VLLTRRTAGFASNKNYNICVVDHAVYIRDIPARMHEDSYAGVQPSVVDSHNWHTVRS
jgi:hypothetical protein